MDHVDAVSVLAEKAWAHRKQFGYLKSLPKEIQVEAAQAARSGKSAALIARALGVTKKTIGDWNEKFKPAEAVVPFKEVLIVEKKTLRAIEVLVRTEVCGCRVEITASSFELAQALLKKL